MTGTTATELSLSTQPGAITWAMSSENKTGLKGFFSIGDFGMADESKLSAPGQARDAAAQLYASLGDLSKDTYRPSFSEPKIANHEFAVGVAATKDAPFMWYTFHNLPNFPGNQSARQTLEAAQLLSKATIGNGI